MLFMSYCSGSRALSGRKDMQKDRLEPALPSAAVVSDPALAGSASAFDSRVVTPSAAVERALSLVRYSESWPWREWPPEALR